MLLVSFSVENYRSITKARKVQLQDYTLLVGPNNEGKSNVLHALNAAMETLSSYRNQVHQGRVVRVPGSASYQWARDFPIQLQNKPTGTSDITLEFELTEDEVEQFFAETKSRLNGTLPIQISLGQSQPKISIQKPGRGHVTLNRKAQLIAAFVSQRISFDYIPAVRTASSAETVVSRLLEAELAVLERDDEYLSAMKKIDELQTPLLEALSRTIQKTMTTFLPTVKEVRLQPEAGSRARALRRGVEVLINDGVETALGRKGDGVQSLVALSLMRHASERRGKSNSIVAIEEPESHLHPNAIHELRNVVSLLSKSAQVVVTSHSPLFINRERVGSNIIVNNNKARPAVSLKELREVLGVRFSDNLQNAAVILLVEGSDDQKALTPILMDRNAQIREAIDGGLLQLDFLGGASSLSYKASQYINSACRVHAFLDNDASGKTAFDKARFAKLLDVADVNFATVPTQTESELEDLYDIKLYRDAFVAEFGVDLSVKIPGKARKWSDMTERKFAASGKPWDDKIKSKVKNWLATFAADHPEQILQPHRALVIDGLVTSLVARLAP